MFATKPLIYRKYMFDMVFLTPDMSYIPGIKVDAARATYDPLLQASFGFS